MSGQNIRDIEKNIIEPNKKPLRNNPMTMNKIYFEAASGFPYKETLGNEEERDLNTGNPAVFHIGEYSPIVAKSL